MSEKRDQAETKQIAFIGGGNMAEGIIKGMTLDGQLKGKQIRVFDIIAERIRYLADTYGIEGCKTTQEAVKDADAIIFAVRPQDAEHVSAQLKGLMKKDSLFVSICAGVTIGSFEKWLGEDRKIARVMPNTLTETKHGFSAVCFNRYAEDTDKALLQLILNAIGQTVCIAEGMFDTFTAYSCAGPAYLLFLMNAMIDAGVRAGFSRKDSREMTIENFIGTARKTNMTGKHPFEILDTMTSPAGVGIEGIYTMQQEGVYGGVMHSIEEAVKKAGALG